MIVKLVIFRKVLCEKEEKLLFMNKCWNAWVAPISLLR